jgi:hypothetical protein
MTRPLTANPVAYDWRQWRIDLSPPPPQAFAAAHR